MKSLQIKAVENLLLIPIALFVLLAFQSNGHTVDIHWHDTYYIIASSLVIYILLGLLVLTFILLKLIRRRHHTVPGKWVIILVLLHILLATVVIVIFSLAATADVAGNGYQTEDITKLMLYVTLKQIAVGTVLAVQAFFLVRCVIRLLKPVVPH